MQTKKRGLNIATLDEIRKGETTDIYLKRTEEILEKEGWENTTVVAEVTASTLPRDWRWGGVLRPRRGVNPFGRGSYRCLCNTGGQHILPSGTGATTRRRIQTLCTA